MATKRCRKIEPIITRDGATGRLLSQFCGNCERDLEATAIGYRHLDSTRDSEAMMPQRK
jgi:hypothetical protein